MPISRARNNQHKVYIPSSARTNHYLLVKFPFTDKLIAQHNQYIDRTSEQPYQKLYQKLADSFSILTTSYILKVANLLLTINSRGFVIVQRS